METQVSKTYYRNECAIFLKTSERYGGLSNMAGGYPLCINGLRILTSEALYQACRFPHKPDVQKIIIGQKSPMTAKMVSKPYRKESRSDWDEVRVTIMRWCLRVKLAQNWEKFSNLLLSTGNCPIVEESYRDPFWGAKPIDQETLVGINVLGQLLTELREQLKSPRVNEMYIVEPPNLSSFLLIEKPIGVIESPQPKPAITQKTIVAVADLLTHTSNGADTSNISTQTPKEEIPLPQDIEQPSLWSLVSQADYSIKS